MGSCQWCVVAPADEGALGVRLSPWKVVGLFSSDNASHITTFRFAVAGKGMGVEHSLECDIPILIPSQNMDPSLDHVCYYYRNEPGVMPCPS